MFLVTMGIMVGGAGATMALAANVGVTDVVEHVQRLNAEVEEEIEIMRQQDEERKREAVEMLRKEGLA